MSELKPVSSSSIARVGHDATKNELHVEFKNGGHYVYHGVPQEEHEAMLRAPSIGAHFQTRIRGKFNHRKVS
jgi:KTSC domain